MSYEERPLKEALKARWDVLPEHVKRRHWYRFTYEEKWDLTYRHVNFDSWRYISISNWDIEYNPQLHQPEDDPVTALKRVFEDRQEHPEILEVFFYPSGKVSAMCVSHWRYSEVVSISGWPFFAFSYRGFILEWTFQICRRTAAHQHSRPAHEQSRVLPSLGFLESVRLSR